MKSLEDGKENMRREIDEGNKMITVAENMEKRKDSQDDQNKL